MTPQIFSADEYMCSPKKILNVSEGMLENVEFNLERKVYGMMACNDKLRHLHGK